MKIAVAGMIFLVNAALCVAQPQAAPQQRIQVTPPNANLNAILQQIQQTTSSASTDIGKLRIEKWKTDADQKQQLLQVAQSLQKNIANAVPGLITDVQTSKGGVVASFKLYHNLNVLYEFLSSLADAAGSLGKKDEYEPLTNDANSLDSERQNLSTYIEQAATRLETTLLAAQAKLAAPAPTPSKVVVIDENAAPAKKTTKPRKKKSSAAKPDSGTGSNSGTAAPAQTSSTPH